MLWRQAGSTGHRAPFHTTNPAEGSGAAPLRTVILSGYLYNMNQSEGLILKLTRTQRILSNTSPHLVELVHRDVLSLNVLPMLSSGIGCPLFSELHSSLLFNQLQQIT